MAEAVHEKLRGVLAGNRDAATWLYDTFAPLLLRRLRQRYGYLSGEDVEDVIQDAFLLTLRDDGRLLRAFLDESPDGGPDEQDLARRFWDLACGLVANRRRSASTRRVVPLGDREEIALRPTAENEALDRDLLQRLDRCLAGGGEAVYLYYKLRYRDGLSPEEIVQVTGWSRKATYKLKQRLNREVTRCADALGISLP